MQDLLKTLKALSEETRLRIIAMLTHGEFTVNEITETLDQSQPRISRHLKLLVDAGLVRRTAEGTQAFFRLAREGDAAALLESLLAMIPPDSEMVRVDQDRLMRVRKARAERAREYFDAIAPEWNKVRSLHVPEEEVEKSLLDLARGRPIHSMLDIGTGTGRMLEIFSPHVEEALGVDNSREMLAIARGTLAEKALKNASVRLADMYALPVQSGITDLVVIHQVLHYADDPEAVIREAARVLAPRGMLLVVDFAPHGQEFLRDEYAHRRLGFSDEEVNDWLSAQHINLMEPRALEGRKLTVKIWGGEVRA